MLMCAAFASLTLNEPTEGIPLFFASLGLFHSRPSASRLAARRPRVVAVRRRRDRRDRLARRGLELQLERQRPTIGQQPHLQRGVGAAGPAVGATMRFQVPERYKGMRAGDIRRVVAHLARSPAASS